MVPLPSAEPLEVNAVETVERLTHSHTSKNHQNENHPQSIYSHASSTNNSTTNSPQNNAIHSHDQSNCYLTTIQCDHAGIKKLCGQSVTSDITKITQACITAQETTGKLIENVISQALTKPQDSTPLVTTL